MPSTCDEVPDSVLAGAWNDNLREPYGFTGSRAFYDLRRERGIVPTARRGRRPSWESLGTSRSAIDRAEAEGTISDRTGRRYRQVATTRKRSKAGKLDEKRGRLCQLYRIVRSDLNDFIARLLVTYCVLREFLRQGLDPLRLNVRWTNVLYTVADFTRLARVQNGLVQRSPSMHSALFGRDGCVDDTLHMHNVFMRDDAWYKSLVKLVEKWTSWGIFPDVIVQLVSFASTFNSSDTICALDRLAGSGMSSEDAWHGRCVDTGGARHFGAAPRVFCTSRGPPHFASL